MRRDQATGSQRDAASGRRRAPSTFRCTGLRLVSASEAWPRQHHSHSSDPSAFLNGPSGILRRRHPHLRLLADDRVPEEKARLILVVRAAAQLDVIRRGYASCRIGHDVMELDERGLAASALGSGERAASIIALPHCTPDSRGYVTSRCSSLACARPRRRHSGISASLEIVDQQRQCTIEDRADIAIRQRMSGKRLRAPQLFMRLACQRHLQLVAFRREWRDDGGAELRRWRSDVLPA